MGLGGSLRLHTNNCCCTARDLLLKP